MEPTTRAQFDSLWSTDRARQNAAYTFILQALEQPVDWAYAVWDEVVGMLSHPDNHNRSIAAQVLSRLAKSDPDFRLRRDFPALLNVTRDERFVTARHALQSLWQIGLAGDAQRQMVLDGLEGRFRECGAEKNATLIRYDILQGLRSLYDAAADGAAGDETLRVKALALIETEPDLKYRKKYATLWRVTDKGNR